MIEWIVKSPSGRRYGDYFITVAVNKTGHKNAVQKRFALCLRFSKEAQTHFRLMAGDRLMVGYDKTTKQICFKRTTDIKSSYALSSSKSTGQNILTLTASTDLPWHESVLISQSDTHETAGVVAIDAPAFFGAKK